VPPIRSRRPLWDLAHPENPDPIVGGLAARDGFVLEKNRVGIVSFLITESVFFSCSFWRIFFTTATR
jgi:hypothetical protein